MWQLERKKCSFLLCLGMSIIICSVIHLGTRIPSVPTSIEPKSCKPFSTECKALLSGTEEGVKWCQRDSNVVNYFLNSELQCSSLARDLHFITRPLSREEESYPLAFILTVHKDMEVFVRLLRAIYMPQNVYCIHVDAKSPLEYRMTVQRLARCFKNILVSSHSETVVYAGFSRLQADLHCMKDLVKSDIGWKKVFNLCGQDFPIMSNLELVRYMQSKQWRDKNMTPGVKQPGYMKHRTQFQHKEEKGPHFSIKKLKLKKGPPPHNIQVYFGTAYYALTRAFVDFALENPIAQDFLEWSKDTYSPDEHYWVTLNHIKDAPGSRIEGGWEGSVRAIKWRDQAGKSHNGCKGHYVRGICVYGMADLPWIIKKDSMFANKFESNTFPEALDCLEQWHRNKVINQTSVPIEPSWLLATKRKSSISHFNSSARP